MLLSPIIITLAVLLLIWLERRFPYDREQWLFREGFWNDLALYTIIQSYGLSFAIFGLINLIDSHTNLREQQILSGLPVAVQVLLSLFVHDCYIYWFHRLQHRNRWLWRLHEAHHSTKDVDWLSGSRSHSGEILINQTIEFAPIVLLGCAEETVLIKGMIDAIWGMYIHSNINVRSGWLQYIINGPEMHRWHHATDAEAHNRNFATKFAFWDWLFGTAYFPQEKKPSGYGLDIDFPEDYLDQHIFAFRKFEEEEEMMEGAVQLRSLSRSAPSR